MNHWTQWSWTSSVYNVSSLCLGVFWLISQQPLPNFLQVYKTPCCWSFCKLLGLAHCYQPFLYSSGIDICICLVSFPYDIYDKFTHHYPTYGLLYVEFRFGICICVCQGCQTLFMISSIQGCHFPYCLLCEQHLILKPCCHVFSGAIDVANLNRVLHWLWHFHMSHCAYVYLFFPVLRCKLTSCVPWCWMVP